MEFFSVMMSKYASSSLIHSPFGKSGLNISHLTFADDLIVFSKASTVAIANLKHFLDYFKEFTGLGINWTKSVIFFANCVDEEQIAISSLLNVTQSNPPIRYLGVPLSSKKLNFNDCQPLLAKVQQ